MTLAPVWRTRLFTAGAGVMALLLSVQLASGQYLWPTVTAGGLGLFLLTRIQPLPLMTLLLCAVIAGYIVANRGFAQLSLSATIPLLPAEAVLLVGGGLLVTKSAWRRQLPFRADGLNIAILTWIAIGSLRIGFDLREFGIIGLRDFALVYYAAFFFLGQDMARDSRSRRLFEKVLLGACTLLLLVFPLYEQFPNFFFNTLVWRGNPLIFYKGDLVATFMAAGAVLYFLRFDATGQWWNLAVSLGFATAVMALNNRAAILALFVATAWLAIAGRWRFAAVQAISGTVIVIMILVGASVARISWQNTPLFSVYEGIVSIFDPSGQRTYRGEQTFSKGDNNLYRAVWWRAAIDETIEENPYFGLGFGRDLAERFVRLYYPENAEDFSVRSPHNVFISIFARMGVLGLAAFLALTGAMAVRTWQAIRLGSAAAGLWCAAWAILVSACFGVVLEGPMGAVAFWTLLGIANRVFAAEATQQLFASGSVDETDTATATTLP